MTLTWITAGESLPNPDELVLLHLPEYQYPRPHLARLIKGDPEAEGTYYQRDHWMLTSWGYNSPPVQAGHQWARVPAPDGVTWADVPATLTEPEPVPEPAPVTPPQADPTQPNLFGGAP